MFPTFAGIALQPAGAYELRVHYRYRPAEDAGTAHAVIGPDFGIRVSRLDAEEGDPRWREERLHFVAPDNAATAPVRLTLGQWQLKGASDFDQVELYPVKLSHRGYGGGVLGEGESVTGPNYLFAAPLDTWRTVSRPLAGFTAVFHDNRWRFMADGQYVVYRHAVAGRRLVTAAVNPGVWFHEPSSLRLKGEVSTDGQRYRSLGEVRHSAPAPSFAVPPDLLPAAEVWVRMSCDAADASPPTFFQVNGYELSATLAGAPRDGAGQTTALTVLGEVERRQPGRPVLRLLALGELERQPVEVRSSTFQLDQVVPQVRWRGQRRREGHELLVTRDEVRGLPRGQVNGDLLSVGHGCQGCKRQQCQYAPAELHGEMTPQSAR
ncbi:MAG: hypothetical protein GW911_08580 [Armatimonadetes bacterium]|nr:hypothetical protein [Armatimonadota bacterium]NCO94805.1 hypothetical protein [Armatimonadota bacterium]NCP34359.1 hypothetical protein [Armatimonadota bacterium]NCQ30150.1 hypothetical protein [Armatimonadota bacterium]NDK12091.1 hypothetical protein [Armatimonadota bacterium]